MTAETPARPLANPLTFMAGCLARTPFRQQVEAAAQAGFGALTLWPNTWRHALRKDGLSLAGMRDMLRDHGLRLTDADACRDWVPDFADPGKVFGPIRTLVPRHDFFEVINALGGTGVVAVHITDAPLHWDRDVAAFARLCDDAGAHGLRVSLEFMPFSNVPDVATAWALVQAAGRPNAGLVIDFSHHVRSGRDDAALRQVPPERIHTVQINDGPVHCAHSPADEAVYHRQWPGQGELDVVQFLRLLRDMGVSAPLGPEIYHADFESQRPVDVARELARTTRDVLQKI